MDSTKFYDKLGNRYIKKNQQYSANYHGTRLETARGLLKSFPPPGGGGDYSTLAVGPVSCLKLRFRKDFRPQVVTCLP